MALALAAGQPWRANLGMKVVPGRRTAIRRKDPGHVADRWFPGGHSSLRRDGPAIDARGLVRRCGDREGPHGTDLVVPHGMVGFLGPNGTGNATTVEIPEGSRRPTAGQASVLGIDPASGGDELRERTGMVLQDPGHNPDLTVRETVRQSAGDCHRPRPVDEVVGLVGLEEAANFGFGPPCTTLATLLP
jgi:hypothetical protein